MPREVHKTIHEQGNCEEQFADFLSSRNSKARSFPHTHRNAAEDFRT
jgi:hypothetical protein